VKERGIEGLEFPGFQQIDTLPRWYAGAGAFVHPALEEPWGLVINEAMASGLPVLCSRTTGASELVEDGVNGFLFDPRDAAQIAGLLARMAGSSPDELARMGAFSSRLVDERAPSLAFGRGLAKILSNQ
jgi:glycosyltransferase involved in cell wall biosynthesis